MALPSPEAADSQSRAAAHQSLKLYLTETAPAPIERKSFGRWLVLSLLAILLHAAALQFAPSFLQPPPPPPVEVQPIDAAKLDAIKSQWKQRKFLLAKDPSETKVVESAPKDARYESDRNRAVEKEMQGRKQDVISRKSGDPNAKVTREKRIDAKKIPLSNLSNFQGLPVPGPRPEEVEKSRGRPGETADQYLADPNLPVGAETMLNTVESVYYSFYARLTEQIGPLWQSNVREVGQSRKIPPGEYSTVAEIVFDADGNYVGTFIQKESGIPALDAVIHRSWARVPRFPNPPRDLIQRDGKIHMIWSFNYYVDQSQNWQYVPPQRQN